MCSKLTCVSSFYYTKNKHGNKYDTWMKKSLSIDCPYVFFGDKESLAKIRICRGELPTHYIELEISDFVTFQYKDKMVTDSTHCPSVELNLIWNEKIFLLQKAAELNPFGSVWFQWIDAGICIYRDEAPPSKKFPNENILMNLPVEKVMFSSSNRNIPDFKKSRYDHCFAATSYLVHSSIICSICKIYKEYLDKLVDDSNIWTDQVIWTHILIDHPSFFHRVCDGYGELTRYLYSRIDL